MRGTPEADGGHEYLEYVAELNLTLRYPELWAHFVGRYIRALRSALEPLYRDGWRPEGPLDWATMHAAGRLRERSHATDAAAPVSSLGRFAPALVCETATIRLRRRIEGARSIGGAGGHAAHACSPHPTSPETA